jgi:hypothetical protein
VVLDVCERVSACASVCAYAGENAGVRRWEGAGETELSGGKKLGSREERAQKRRESTSTLPKLTINVRVCELVMSRSRDLRAA